MANGTGAQPNTQRGGMADQPHPAPQFPVYPSDPAVPTQTATSRRGSPNLRPVPSGNGTGAQPNTQRGSVADRPRFPLREFFGLPVANTTQTPQDLPTAGAMDSLLKQWAAWLNRAEHHAETSYAKLCDIDDVLHELLDYARRRDPVREWLPLNANPLRLDTRGYRHNRMWMQSAATIQVDVGGLAQNFMLGAGWTPTDFENGTLLSAASATNVRVEYTDEIVT